MELRNCNILLLYMLLMAIIMTIKRTKQIIRKLRPYVNGKLITGVFEKYFNELEQLINKEEN